MSYCSHELTECSHDHILPTQGSSTSMLELNDLQRGDYVFTLTVTDGSNQQSSAEVSVAVVEGKIIVSDIVCLSTIASLSIQRPISHQWLTLGLTR